MRQADEPQDPDCVAGFTGLYILIQSALPFVASPPNLPHYSGLQIDRCA